MSSTASTAFSDHVSPVETASSLHPPNRPLFVEPIHFYSKCSPALIRQHLEEICTQSRIDVMPGVDLFSMVCSAYVDHASSNFRVSIFTDDKSAEQRYLIEIQRRSGESYAFHEAMSGIRSSLYERKVIEKSTSPVKRSWSDKAKAAIAARTKSCEPDALDRLNAQSADGCVLRSVLAHQERSIQKPASAYSAFPIVETDDVVVASVNHAVRLAASPYEDIKSEAIRAMAGMANQEQSQRALLASIGADGRRGESVKVTVACLRSVTPDVHRCAASTLANLLSAPISDVADSARELVESHGGADEMFRLILREKSETNPDYAPVSPQVIRECARALVALYGDSSASSIPHNSQAVRAIQKMHAHYCPVVREYAEHLESLFM
jgi:hypothetical protein